MSLSEDFPEGSDIGDGPEAETTLDFIPYHQTHDKTQIDFFVVTAFSTKILEDLKNMVNDTCERYKKPTLSKNTVMSLIDEHNTSETITKILADSGDNFPKAINMLVDGHDKIHTPEEALAWLEDKGINNIPDNYELPDDNVLKSSDPS